MKILSEDVTESDQRGAQAGGHIVGRDLVTVLAPQSRIEKLLCRLKEQYDKDERARSTMDELARYHCRRAPDGIMGLEAKLSASGRSEYYNDAIEKKEMFSKLLAAWSLYSAAQQIFVHILARAENEFNSVIYGQIPSKTIEEINALVIDRIVNPIVEECCSDTIFIDHNIIQGMVYWLAEQCFIKWHHKVKAQ